MRIFEPKRDDNEKLHSLYRSPNIVRVIKSRRLRWADHLVRMEKGSRALKSLTGKPAGKRLLDWHRCTWEGNIRWILKNRYLYETLDRFDSG